MGALRGIKLDQSLFHDTVVMELPPPERRGRSEAKITERNDFLIARYVYYKLFFRDLRYEAVIRKLAAITWLEDFTVSKIIAGNTIAIQQLLRENRDKSYFKKRYPDVVWE